jgi:hypothetical protein
MWMMWNLFKYKLSRYFEHLISCTVLRCWQVEGIEILCPKDCLNWMWDMWEMVNSCLYYFSNSVAAIISWILFVYLYVIAAKGSVVTTALVLGMGYDLAGHTQNIKSCFARFVVLIVGLLKIQLFWGVMVCHLVKSPFQGGYCCHVRDANINMKGNIFYKLVQYSHMHMTWML